MAVSQVSRLRKLFFVEAAPLLVWTIAGAMVALQVDAWAGTDVREQIQVRALDCTRGVRVVARQAMTSDVLRRLADVEGFRLTMDEPIEQRVDVDIAQPTYDMLVRLLDARNFIITQRPDRRCPGQLRVAHIWVLKNGAGPAPNMPRGVLPPTKGYVTPEAREHDELYQRAHGMLPEQPEDKDRKSP